MNVNDLALILIDKSHQQGLSITNQRLQKLLYFVQALFIKEKGTLCFLDPMEAWTFGPVVPSVYSVYRIFGGNLIPEIKEVMDSKKKIHRLCDVQITEDEERLIDRIIKLTAAIPTREMIRITQFQTPWRLTYDPKVNRIIDPSLMLKRFSKMKGILNDET